MGTASAGEALFSWWTWLKTGHYLEQAVLTSGPYETRNAEEQKRKKKITERPDGIGNNVGGSNETRTKKGGREGKSLTI